MNGALDEAMEIMKGSLADNSQVEQPYRTEGKIFLDENNDISSIYIKGILVDFEIVLPINKYTRGQHNDEDLEEMGWEKQTDKKNGISDWIMTDNISSREWENQKQSYFDF